MSHDSAVRRFSDRSGTHWRVFQVRRLVLEDRDYLGEEWRSGWLVFESSLEKRRLAPVPADWSSLTDDALDRLCESATRALTAPDG